MTKSLSQLLEQVDQRFKVEEENTTSNLDGGQGQPKTPYAFAKKVQDPDDPSYPEDVIVERFYKRISDLCEGDYKSFKRDDSRNEKQKINGNILEINRKLREVEQMIDHAKKLKLETGQDSTVYWKGTFDKFLKIKERLNRLSKKIVEISG